MAQLVKTEITGSLTDTGSLIISGSQPIQLPLLNSGSGDVNPDLITRHPETETVVCQERVKVEGSKNKIKRLSKH